MEDDWINIGEILMGCYKREKKPVKTYQKRNAVYFFVVYLLMALIYYEAFCVPQTQEPPNPMIQSHTRHKEIIGNAILQPVGESKITGTVEFEKSGNKAKVLVTLANANPGEKFSVSVIDTKRC